jgi:hypothetical protein
MLWVHPLAAALAMSSKFVLRVKGKHLYNPANLGVIAAISLFPGTWVSPGQWGNDLALAVWLLMLGTIVTQRAKRLDVSWVFLGAFLGLVALRVPQAFDLVACPESREVLARLGLTRQRACGQLRAYEARHRSRAGPLRKTALQVQLERAPARERLETTRRAELLEQRVLALCHLHVDEPQAAALEAREQRLRAAQGDRLVGVDPQHRAGRTLGGVPAAQDLASRRRDRDVLDIRELRTGADELDHPPGDLSCLVGRELVELR